MTYEDKIEVYNFVLSSTKSMRSCRGGLSE